VGEEVCQVVNELARDQGRPALPFPAAPWFGEPPDSVRDDYFHQARLMNLDAMTSPQSSEKLSTRLWRRYGSRALGLLENIRADTGEAEVLIHGAEYIRCEIEQAARHEMIVKLEDFLRRRSKIALVMRREELKNAAGLREACEILFGPRAKEKLEEYFATSI